MKNIFFSFIKKLWTILAVISLFSLKHFAREKLFSDSFIQLITITTDLKTPPIFCSGTQVTVNAAASGADTYIWQEEISVGNWQSISGANGSMAIAGEMVWLTLNNLSNSKKIRCLFSNNGGINILTSSEITLMPQQPSIIRQPISQTSCEGNIINFITESSGGNTFFWQRKKSGEADFLTVNNSTNIVLTNTTGTSELKIKNIGNSENPHNSIFRCIISDANNCWIVSNQVILSVNSINNIADSPAICVGGNTSFLATFIGTTTAIKWQKGTIETTASSYNDLDDNPPNIVGTSSSLLSLSNLSLTDDKTFYRIRATFTTQSNSGAGTCTRTQTVSAASNSGKLLVNALPIAPTAPDVSRCDAGKVVLLASSKLLTNENFRWYKTDTSSEILGTDTSYTTASLAVGSYIFYLSTYNQATTCESTRTPIKVTINPLPNISLASVGIVCNHTTSFNLPFSSTINDPNQYSILALNSALNGFLPVSNAPLESSPIEVKIPVNIKPATYQFIFSVKNSITGCASVEQIFSITNSQTPSAPTAISLINYCHYAPTNALSAIANATNTLLWYRTNLSDETASFDAPIPNSEILGTVSYEVSQKNTDNCESSRTIIRVNTNPVPEAPIATTPIIYCKNNTASILSATAIHPNSLVWYEGDAVLATTPIPNTILAGSQTFKVSQRSPSPASCESKKTNITLIVNELPETPTVVSPVGYCQNTSASVLSAVAANTLLWYGNKAIAGIASSTAPTPITNLAGTSSYYVSQKDFNNCESLRAKIDVIITPSLSATITGTNAFCTTGVLNTSSILRAIPVGGNSSYTYQWQNLAGNIESAKAQIFEVNNTLQIDNLDTYKAIITSGYCTTNTSLSITKQGWSDVPSVAGNTPEICGNGSKILNITNPSTMGTYRWFGDAATLTESGNGINFSTPNLGSTTTYYVAREQQITPNLSCQTIRKAVIIYVNSPPKTPLITNTGKKTTFCNNEPPFGLSIACESGNGYYRLNKGSWISGNSVEINPTSHANTSSLEYEFKCSLAPTCESAVLGTTINIQPVPAIPTISGNTSICSGNSAVLTASGCSSGIVAWSNGNTGTSISVSPLVSSNYTATCSNSTCISERSNQLNMVVNNYPNISTEPKSESDCNGNSVTFSLTASPVTFYQWQRKTPNGTFTNINNAHTKTLTISKVGNETDPNQTEYRVVVSNESCHVNSATAVLTVNSIAGILADQTICEGENIYFDLTNFTIFGDILAYQWQRRATTSGTWNDINGATTTRLSLSAPSILDEQYYRCKIIFKAGNSTCLRYTTENNAAGAKLTILRASKPSISGIDTICLSKSTTLTANHCGGKITWSNGQTSSTISISPASSTSYSVNCQSEKCGFNTTSEPYLVTVINTPKPEIITNDVVSPTILTFTAQTTLPNGNLMWYENSSGGVGSPTAPSFTAIGTHNYWLTQIDPRTGCESPRTLITAKLLDNFRITQQAGNQVACKGNTVYFGLVAVGPNSTFIYQWQRKRPNESDFVNLTDEDKGIRNCYTSKMAVTNIGSTDNPHFSEYRCIIKNKDQTLSSEVSILFVNSLVGSLPNLGTCIGTQIEYRLPNYFSITGDVIAYQWQTRPKTSGDWTNINDEGSIAGSQTNTLKLMSVTYEQGVYYRCLVKFNTQGFECTEPTDISKLTVGNFPAIPSVDNIFYCQNAKAIKLKVNSPFQNLIWYLQGTGLNTAPTPKTDIAGVFKYDVADRTDEGCESPKATIHVVVEKLPNTPKNTTPSSINEGSLLIFSAEGTPPENQLFRWYTSPTSTAFTTFPPTFAAPGTYTRYVAQISPSGCVGPRTFISANIIPKLKFIKQPISQADCDGNSITFSVSAVAPSAFTYQWQKQKPNDSTFKNLENETANILIIKNIGNIENPNLTKYRCLIKDEIQTIISENAIMTVNQINDKLPSISICDMGKPSSLSLNKFLTTGTVAGYQWQRKTGSTYVNLPTNTDGFSLINDGGTYRGRISFFTNGNATCIRSTADFIIEEKPTPPAPKIASRLACQSPSFDISKNIIASNQLLWYEADFADTNPKTIPPSIDLSKWGEIKKYFVSQITSFGCESERTMIDITISPTPEKPLVKDVNYCRNAPSTLLLASTEKQNEIKWYGSPLDKEAFSRIPQPITETDGEIIYFASAKNTAGCESERVPLKISINPCINTFEGNFDACSQVSVDEVNANRWYDFHDNSGKLYASINPNGLNLGKVLMKMRHYGKKSKDIPSTKNNIILMPRYANFQSSLLNEFKTPVSIRIYYQNEELDTFKSTTSLAKLDINNLNIIHYNGIEEDCDFLNNDNFTAGNSYINRNNVKKIQITEDFFYLQFDVNEFTEIGASSNDFNEIIFGGKETENQTIALNWQTTDETKAEKYIIERSGDCQNFTQIGEIKAKGLGSTYEKIDFQPSMGKSCYRLIYINKDGTKRYLNMVEIDFTDLSPAYNLFPNPSVRSDEMNLYLRNIKEKEIKIYDIFGRSFPLLLTNNESQIIKIRPKIALNEGTYFLIIIDENGKKYRQKIIVNP